jgi:hypothetical protein
MPRQTFIWVDSHVLSLFFFGPRSVMLPLVLSTRKRLKGVSS